MVANADAVQVGQGGDRLRQGQSRQAELRLGRHRLQRASRHRAVQRRRRHQDAARALQPDVAEPTPTCSPAAPRSGSPPLGGSLPHIQLRQGARARGQRAGARQAAARAADHDRARHQDGARSRAGTASSRRRARRRRSSTRSIATCRRSSTCRTCGSASARSAIASSAARRRSSPTILKTEIAKWDELAKKGAFK